jgi:hypothetical protein
MRSAKSIGRTVGILLLLQLAAGLMVPFILLLPLVPGSPEFLTAATETFFSDTHGCIYLFHRRSAYPFTLGITMLPVFRRYSNATALWFLAVCLISLYA